MRKSRLWCRSDRRAEAGDEKILPLPLLKFCSKRFPGKRRSSRVSFITAFSVPLSATIDALQYRLQADGFAPEPQAALHGASFGSSALEPS